MTNEKLLQELERKQVISKKQLNLLKRRMNDDKITSSELASYNIEMLGTMADSELTNQGMKWLYNLAFTKSGKLRKNNPFNSQQLLILSNAKDEIALWQMRNKSMWGKFYVPEWRVFSYVGYFDYYLYNGKIHITETVIEKE